MKDDTIYRQAAIEALLNKGQHSRRYKLGDVWELNFDEIKEVIDALSPAADRNSYYRLGFRAGYQAGQAEQRDAQPEIIRCKDCKHRHKYCFPPQYEEHNYCEKHEKVVQTDWYCSWADRRENVVD